MAGLGEEIGLKNNQEDDNWEETVMGSTHRENRGDIQGGSGKQKRTKRMVRL